MDFLKGSDLTLQVYFYKVGMSVKLFDCLFLSNKRKTAELINPIFVESHSHMIQRNV